MSMGPVETERRLANVIRIGSVVSVDAGAARAVVDFGDVKSPPLAVAQLRAGGLALWWMPTAGEQVIVAVPSGDIAQGIVLASIYAGNAPSSDAGTPMVALGGGKIVFDGDIEVTGKITAQGEIKSEADVIAGPIRLKTHKHQGVASGGAISGEPTP